MEVQGFLDIITTALVTAAVAVIAFFLKKNWDETEKNMEAHRKALEHCHERNDIQDAYLTQIFKHPFDSALISKGKMQMPKGRKPRANS